MPKLLVVDELILTVRVPAALPRKRAAAARRTLASAAFLARLRRAVREALRADQALAPARVSVAR